LFGSPGGIDPIALTMIPAVLLLSAPAGTILYWGTRRGAAVVRPRTTQGWLATVVGIAAIMFVAAYAGVAMWAAVSGGD